MVSTIGAVAVERGCGRRKAGGVYAECGLSFFGMPLEFFVADPVSLIDPLEMGLTPVGQVLYTLKGVTHILDWIGVSYYPRPIDWLEEVRRFGMSTRLELQAEQYSKLDGATRIMPVHPLAYVEPVHPKSYLDESVDMHICNYAWDFCPKERVKEHFTPHKRDGNPEIICAGAMWRSVEDDPGVGVDIPNQHNVPLVRLSMPSFDYEALRAINYGELKFKPAIFAAFPLTRLVVVKGDEADEKLKKLRNVRLPVEVVEE